MTENPLFIYVSPLLCIMKLLFSEPLCFKGFQTPKDPARRVPTGMPSKRSLRHEKIKKFSNLLP